MARGSLALLKGPLASPRWVHNVEMMEWLEGGYLRVSKNVSYEEFQYQNLHQETQNIFIILFTNFK